MYIKIQGENIYNRIVLLCRYICIYKYRVKIFLIEPTVHLCRYMYIKIQGENIYNRTVLLCRYICTYIKIQGENISYRTNSSFM